MSGSEESWVRVQDIKASLLLEAERAEQRRKLWMSASPDSKPDPCDFLACRNCWLAGKCPCCGCRLIPWPAPDGRDIEPAPVAEGVMFCGRCIGNEHHLRPPEVLPMMLEALLPGWDGKVRRGLRPRGLRELPAGLQ